MIHFKKSSKIFQKNRQKGAPIGSNIATLFLPLGPYESLIHKGLNKQSGTRSEMKIRCLLFRDQEAVGSNPATPTIKELNAFALGSFIIWGCRTHGLRKRGPRKVRRLFGERRSGGADESSRRQRFQGAKTIERSPRRRGSNPATPTIKAEEVFASSAFIISSSELSSRSLVSPEPT